VFEGLQERHDIQGRDRKVSRQGDPCFTTNRLVQLLIKIIPR